MKKDFLYEGQDLESMSFAENYHRLILTKFKPYLGRNIVEVGAGSGSFATLISELKPARLAVVEPSEDMYHLLQSSLKQIAKNTKVTLYNDFFANVADKVKQEEKPDSFVYVNVFEHIEDDVKELGEIYKTLGSGGRVCIFVPALQFLYSEFDQKIDHYRRYTKKELGKKAEQVGFRVVHSQYFDMPGILPWWLKFKLGKSDRMDPRSVQLYDKYGVPVLRVLESKIKPPIGKNVLLIAEK